METMLKPMNIDSFFHWEKVKAFILIWVYFITLFLVIQIALSVSTLLNQKFETSWNLCISSRESISELSDSISNVEFEITSPTGRNDKCPREAVDLIVRYQGSVMGYLRRHEPIESLLSDQDIQSIGKSIQTQPVVGPIASYGFGFALVCALVFLRHQRKKRTFIEQPEPLLGSNVIGTLTAACIFGMILFVWLPFQLFAGEIKVPNYLILNTDNLQIGATTWLFFVVLAPFTEEVLFRAWLLEAWRRVIPPVMALILSSVVFSLAHPMGVVANLIFVMPGLLLGALWLKTRSLTACVIAHASYNAFVLLTLILWA